MKNIIIESDTCGMWDRPSIFDIEMKYKNELENIKEWAYLRIVYFFSISNKTNSSSKSPFLNKLDKIIYIFYGFKNWFKKYDYLIFSDSSERKFINGKYFDKTTDAISNILSKDKILFIELPNPFHFKIRNVYSTHIVSDILLRIIILFMKLLTKFLFKKNLEISPLISILDTINKELGCDVDYKTIINSFNIAYRVYLLLLKIYRPKLIIVNCYYERQDLIKAAKDLNILVLEVQHGVIGKVHPAYNTSIKIDKSYIPDYLLLFGEYDKKMLVENSILFDQHNLFPVGHFYLEYIKKRFIPSSELLNIKRNYDITIGVSLQFIVENELIQFIQKVASMLPNVLFILIPRIYSEKYKKYIGSYKNIILYPGLDFYQIVMHCDYHLTVSSTCALEAPYLGIKNILIDIRGFATKYYGDVLSEENSIFIKNEEEFITFFKEIKNTYYDKLEVMKSTEYFFKENYSENLRRCLDEILKKVNKDDFKLI